jgi:hypothetical protein
MKKVYLFLAAICCCLFLFQTVAEAQNPWGSFEVLGGIGLSYLGSDARDEYLRNENWNTDHASEKRSFSFSPGLYTSTKIRWGNLEAKFSYGPYISFSKYSVVFNSIIEREESLGWNYQKNKINLREYKWGGGLFFRYIVFQKDHHFIQTQLSIGMEVQYAHKTTHEQEVRFLLNEEPSFFTYTESYRYSKVPPSISNDTYWTGGVGLIYSYQKGKLIPFSELGFRFLQEIRDDEWPKENWTLPYLNLGIRWSLS